VTSGALAGLLREAGFGVETADDVDAALAGLAAPDGTALDVPSGASAPDLLVVNVGLPRDDLPLRLRAIAWLAAGQTR
jgi:hypothetical protein